MHGALATRAEILVAQLKRSEDGAGLYAVDVAALAQSVR
jgi:hypothetical protein